MSQLFTLSGGVEVSLSKLLFLHSEYGSTLKGKNFLPFIVDNFSDGSCNAMKTCYSSEALRLQISACFRAQ